MRASSSRGLGNSIGRLRWLGVCLIGALGCSFDHRQVARHEGDASAGGDGLDASACDSTCVAALIAGQQFGPQGVVTIAGRPYWTNLDGEIRRCSNAECIATERLYQDVGVGGQVFSATALAADEHAVYWARVETTSPEKGALVSCAIENCGRTVSVLAQFNGQIAEIAVKGDMLFWTVASFADGTGEVDGCDKRDCRSTVRKIAGGQRLPIAVVPSAHGLYWTDAVAGVVMKCKTDDCGEDPTVFARDLMRPLGLVADDHYVYFSSAASGRIDRCAHSGCGDAPEPVAKGQSAPTQLAVDDERLFWVNQGANTLDGTVERCEKRRCSPVTIADGQNNPIALTLSGEHVYWLNVGEKPNLTGGALMEAAASCRIPSQVTTCPP